MEVPQWVLAILGTLLAAVVTLFFAYALDGEMGIAFAPRYASIRLRLLKRKWLHPGSWIRWLRGTQPSSKGLRENCLAPHVPLSLHTAVAAALADPSDSQKRSPWRLVLDSEDAWSFTLKDAGGGELSQAAMPVPSQWQMQGYGTPLYTNFFYPFGFYYPEIAAENSTAVYARSFELPAAWRVLRRRVRLVLNGAGPEVRVRVNGRYVGYAQDAMTPSEFDITAYLAGVEGAHELEVEVDRYASGSFLEDQDHWWLSGIHRSVELLCLPSAHICDYEVRTSIDPPPDGAPSPPSAPLAFGLDAQDASLTVTALLAGAGGAEVGRLSLRARLYDASDDIVAELEGGAGAAPCRPEAVPGFPGGHAAVAYGRAELSAAVAAPLKWSFERPALYTLVLELLDGDGEALQVESCRVGFRDVRVSAEGVLLHNFRPLVVKGANRHEHDAFGGKVVSAESMARDVAVLKRNNFNAARCSHYPNDAVWYELCDAAGLLVVDEANLETHGFALQFAVSMLSCDPQLRDEYVARSAACFHRTKNHCCVLSYSLGNECGYGPNLRAAHAYLRGLRPQVPLQYEAGVRDGDCTMLEGDGQQPLVSDLACPMYHSPAEIAAYARRAALPGAAAADRRPLVLCEYAHAMGNSGGGLAQYWQLFWSRDEARGHQRLQGGFVWDLVDQGLCVPREPLPPATRNAQRVLDAGAAPYHNGGAWGYGGDFGPGSGAADKQFCVNGLLFPDRTPHPSLAEAKALQAPVAFGALEDASPDGSLSSVRVLVESRLAHRRLDGLLEAAFALSAPSQLAPPAAHAPGQPLSAAPGEAAALTLRLGLPPRRAFPHGCWLTLQARLAEAHAPAGLPRGHVVAQRTYCLVPPAPPRRLLAAPSATPAPGPVVLEGACDERVEVLSPGAYRCVLSSEAGGLEALCFLDGGGAAAAPALRSLRHSFFRAPTDNDLGGADMMFPGLARWRALLPRAVTDGFSFASSWRIAGLDRLRRSGLEATWDPAERTYTVREAHGPEGGAPLFATELAFRFEASHLRAAARVTALPAARRLRSLPRVGAELVAPAAQFTAAASLTYLGCGPHECYPDRKHAAGEPRVHGPLRCYADSRSGASATHVPYLFPSESGNRADVEWVAVCDAHTGAGVAVRHATADEPAPPVAPESGLGQRAAEGPGAVQEGDPLFAGRRTRRPAGTRPGSCVFAASRFSSEALAAARHQGELPGWRDGPLRRSDAPAAVDRELRLRIDTAFMGVGGDTSWKPQTHDQFLVKPEGTWTYELSIAPVPPAVARQDPADQRAALLSFLTMRDMA